VVSHDRYFLERVTDRDLALTGGGLAFLPGGVDEYLRIRADEATKPDDPAAPGPARPAVPAAQQRAGQKELTRLERQIARLTEAEARLEEELAASASDYTRLIDLGAQLRGVQQQRAELEERWLVVADEIGS